MRMLGQPREPPREIAERYEAERGRAGFELGAFVERHFELPAAVGADFATDGSRSMEDHVRALWPVLTREPDATSARSSLIPLPHAYVVPGGRFREIYYWDTYFTKQGLEASGRHDLTDDMLANFAYLIDTYSHIPNGNRSYYLSRSQPPYFASMVALVAKRKGDEVYG